MPGHGSLRTRWAAIGAAIAVSLGGGITLGAHAIGGGAGGGNTYTPITPCRLMDTRGGSNNVGDRTTPIQGGTFYEATVHGTNGNCTIPANATGIATNTTVLNGTTASFLTLYPADATRPLASNLNWTAGQPATPNQVTVGLSPDGKIRIYNDRGTVNVIIDIVGIYTDLDVSAFAPAAQTLVIDGAAWEQLGTGGTTQSSGGCIRPTTGAVSGYVPVALPLGATITQARVLVRQDGFAGHDVHLRQRAISSASQSLGSVASSSVVPELGPATIVTHTLTPPDGTTVTGSANYSLFVNLGDVSAHGICRAEIDIVIGG